MPHPATQASDILIVALGVAHKVKLFEEWLLMFVEDVFCKRSVQRDARRLTPKWFVYSFLVWG